MCVNVNCDSCPQFCFSLFSAMISYKLAGNQTTSIQSAILALRLLRLLAYFSSVFDKITGPALSGIFLVEIECSRLIRQKEMRPQKVTHKHTSYIYLFIFTTYCKKDKE